MYSHPFNQRAQHALKRTLWRAAKRSDRHLYDSAPLFGTVSPIQFGGASPEDGSKKPFLSNLSCFLGLLRLIAYYAPSPLKKQVLFWNPFLPTFSFFFRLCAQFDVQFSFSSVNLPIVSRTLVILPIYWLGPLKRNRERFPSLLLAILKRLW